MEKIPEEKNVHLIYKSLRDNEWACFMCLFLSILFQSEHAKKIHQLPTEKLTFWAPLPFESCTQEHIFFEALINKNLCPHQNHAYRYFYYLSKVIGIKFNTRKQWDFSDTCSLESFWFQKKKTDAWNNETPEDWNSIFDTLIDDEILKTHDLPALSFEVITPPKIERLQVLIDELIHLFIEQDGDMKDLMPYKKQRNIVFQKILDAYEITAIDTFFLQEKTFDKFRGFSLTYSLAILWRLGYLEILDIQAVTEEWLQNIPARYSKEQGIILDIDEAEIPRLRELYQNSRNTNYIFQIRLTEKFKEVLKGFWEVRDIILDKIFDEEYKKISLTRKWWAFYMIEGEKEIEVGMIKFVDLQKQYPYGEITAVNHAGKSQKYMVKEKIKLDNESDNNNQ